MLSYKDAGVKLFFPCFIICETCCFCNYSRPYDLFSLVGDEKLTGGSCSNGRREYYFPFFFCCLLDSCFDCFFLSVSYFYFAVVWCFFLFINSMSVAYFTVCCIQKRIFFVFAYVYRIFCYVCFVYVMFFIGLVAVPLS